MNTVKTEPVADYKVSPSHYTVTEQDIIDSAMKILAKRINDGPLFDAPQAVRQYLSLRHAGMTREQFDVLFLDSQNRLICCETMFVGTLNQTSVYPREVVKRSLELNASSVVFSHNHPSGNPTPSRADELLTQTLKQALALVDVRVLDHFITAGHQTVSMAEKGLV